MSLIDITFAGRTFKVDAANGMDQVARQMQAGSYEPPLPFLMMATLLRTEGAFVDVGANTGLYSVLAGTVAPSRDITAFEPHPEIAVSLMNNLRVNDMQGRVTVHQVALSDSSGVLDLYMPDQGHGLIETSASLEKNFQQAASSIQVPVKRLDDIGLDALVAVIKVDIEGHEHAFLRGALELIRRDRPFIFIEVLGGAKRNLLGQFLRETSYLDFRLRPDMAINDGEVLFDDAAWNHAFVPVERVTRFKEACDSCNLPTLRRFEVA
jgi:FkbM family methyltransferase